MENGRDRAGTCYCARTMVLARNARRVDWAPRREQARQSLPKTTHKPPSSHWQAGSLGVSLYYFSIVPRLFLDCSSIVPRLFLDCSSIGALLFLYFSPCCPHPPHWCPLRRHGVAAEPVPDFDSAGLSAIQMISHSPGSPSCRRLPAVRAALLLTFRPAAGMHFTHGPKL
jgi:hypothetical protein